LLIDRKLGDYGIDNFMFEVIATCQSIEDADATEIVLIKQYHSHVSEECGYNLSWGGRSWKQEQRDAHSKLMKAKYASGELQPWNKGLKGEDNPLTGIPRSARGNR